MAKIIQILLCVVTIFTIFSCNKEDKGKIKLSQQSIDFTSSAQQGNIYSSGEGFELVGVIFNGREVTERTNDAYGSLTIKGPWFTVITPDVQSGNIAKRLVIKVDANNTDSTRSCNILVSNGTEQATIKVTQQPLQIEKTKN